MPVPIEEYLHNSYEPDREFRDGEVVERSLPDWLVDPYSRRFYTCGRTFQEVDTLTIPELGIEVRPADIFK